MKAATVFILNRCSSVPLLMIQSKYIYIRIIRLAFLANHIMKIGFNSYEDEQFRFEAK